MRHRLFALAAFFCANLALLFAGQDVYSPKILGPSNEGINALKRISVPKDTVASLVAAEPLLANPVAFCFDEQGNIYVAETFRIYAGVTDNRKHFQKQKSWLDDDLACLTVADRQAMYKKLLAKDYGKLTTDHDRVRKLIDTKGTGVMDKAFVFADGFNTPVSGIGAGVLARQGKVWYTCIPDLWLLEDTKGANKADGKKSLQYGYGVHTAYLGHDLHGLKIGPDGRLYFSIGDRGLHVETGGRVVDNPHSGAVLRCNLDGSNLEIVAVGLRNPQELAFDAYGNLFTGDNNCDKGDKARWVHIVEGGDSGWRIGFQEMSKPIPAGPWRSEGIYQTQYEGQNANVVPPVAYLGQGPSGVTYNPGVTQLPDRYQDHFFMCDFTGGSGKSGIFAMKLKPRGASFEFDGAPQRFVSSVLATDCDFGPDGGFYISDWVETFNMTFKGRIYKVGDPKKAQDPAVLEVKKIIADGMAKRPTAEVAKLLEHGDMRVRQEAQFALVERNAAAELKQALANTKTLPRLHAIWGLGMLQRQNPKETTIAAALLPLLDDKDMDVRCQALKELGDARSAEAFGGAVKQLKAPNARVRFIAAMALGKIGKVEAVPAVAEMLRENADKDPYLRHAGVMALVGIGNREALGRLAKDPSPAVRLASLLAMRRLGMVEVKQFLNDADQRLVVEAAKAINDQPIEAAMPDLAALGDRTGMSAPLLYRVINANFRVKQKANAEALARIAGRADVPEAVRVEALDCLRTWDEPWTRDRIVGLYRPVPAGPAKDAADAVRTGLGGIFAGSNKVRTEGARVAAKFGIKEVGPALRQIVGDVKRPAAVRVESLKALAVLKDAELEFAMRLALDDADPRVRTAGRTVMATLEPKAILGELKKALDSTDIGDRQGAFAILGNIKQPGVNELVESWLDKLLAKQVAPEVHLDLLEAAAKHKSAASIAAKLAKFEATRSPQEPLAKWMESLHGGDAENGKRIFLERSELSCVRCHKVQGNGGDVGPDLTGIGTKQKRDYLLEAIVLPDKQIAQGYETVVVTLVDGKVKSGILKSEDQKEVRLMTPEGAILVVPVKDIETRMRGPSAMPADLVRSLSARDLRDLVEYLVNLK